MNFLLKWLITLTVCTIVLVAVQARAGDEWSKKDIQLEIACVVVNVLDGVTTERILDENNRAFEAGPARLLFGDRPSQAELAGVVVVSSVLHALVTHYMPKQYRQYWQWSWASVKLLAIGNNLHVGLGIQF